MSCTARELAALVRILAPHRHERLTPAALALALQLARMEVTA